MRKVLLILLVIFLGYWLNNKIQNWMDSTFKTDKKISQPWDEEVGETELAEPQPIVQKKQNYKNSKSDYPQESNSIPQPSTSDLDTNETLEEQPLLPDQEELKPKISLPDGSLVYKDEVPSGLLVSCQTQIQNCEPKDQQQYDDPYVNTFCITYANYCISSDSIQRSWADDEVFKPINENLEDPNTIVQDPDYIDQYPNQLPIHPDYPQEPVPPLEPPPGPEFYDQQPPGDEQGSYPSQDFFAKFKSFS